MPSNLLYGQSQMVADWVAARIPGCERGFNKCQGVGVLRGTELIAGVVFHNWSPESGTIEVSAAATSPKWATRKNLTELFAYPFEGIGCRLVIARTSEANKRVRKLWLAFGATEHILPDLRAEGVGECVLILTKDAWQKSRFNNG